MFNKKSKIDPSSTDTLIGEGSTFEGKIRSKASVRLEGEITGDLECEGDVVIGEKGVARSNVTARNVVLAGEVHGNVTAKGKLTIKSSGRLSGNLSVQELAIEAGGYFAGMSRMNERNAADAKAEAQQAEEGTPASATSSSAAANQPAMAGSQVSYHASTGSGSGLNPNDGGQSNQFRSW